MLAEFIVATALGIPVDGVREGWAAWDLTAPGGIRAEVKSAPYLQSWAQKELSRITFATPRTLAWDADGRGFAGVARTRPGVYSRRWTMSTRPRWTRWTSINGCST